MINNNLIIQGENIEVMKYFLSDQDKLSCSVDLMLWDPPYNTGRTDMKYKDKFFSHSKDRHSQWILFMRERLELARELLKISGSIAVHIGYQELFRLGLLMDEVFGEEDRLGIINWECSYSPKNDNKGISSTTDYVLVYANEKKRAFRGIIPRTKEMDARYKNYESCGDSWASDNLSTMGRWKNSDLSSPGNNIKDFYGIENPLTGVLHLPPTGRSWRYSKKNILSMLGEWDIAYYVDGDGNCRVSDGENRQKVAEKYNQGNFPRLYWGKECKNGPRIKRYRSELKSDGRSIATFWNIDEFIDESLRHELSGHNGEAKCTIKAILGDNMIFCTPKPLKITERIIQLLCPIDGIVLDAFAGSGTTAHAVLSLNEKNGDKRRFILIEQDKDYVKTITCERVDRVIKGNWDKPKKDTSPLGGSYEFWTPREYSKSTNVSESW